MTRENIANVPLLRRLYIDDGKLIPMGEAKVELVVFRDESPAGRFEERIVASREMGFLHVKIAFVDDDGKDWPGVLLGTNDYLCVKVGEHLVPIARGGMGEFSFPQNRLSFLDE